MSSVPARPPGSTRVSARPPKPPEMLQLAEWSIQAAKKDYVSRHISLDEVGRRVAMAVKGAGTACRRLPWVISVLLLVGSFVIIGYTVLAGSRSFWFHAIGACAIALVLGLSLVVLLDLAYPFSSDLSVGSGPFQSGALAQFLRGLALNHRSASPGVDPISSLGPDQWRVTSCAP